MLWELTGAASGWGQERSVRGVGCPSVHGKHVFAGFRVAQLEVEAEGRRGVGKDGGRAAQGSGADEWGVVMAR